MEALKLITPFLTFILGVISTILFKRLDKRKEYLNKSLDELRDLVNAWYNQLHEIYFDLQISPTVGKPSKFLFYINNRLVLPKLLHHLEVLRKYKKASNVVLLTEEFLCFVTNYNKSLNEEYPILSNDVEQPGILNNENHLNHGKEKEQLPEINNEILFIQAPQNQEINYLKYSKNDINFDNKDISIIPYSCIDVLSGNSLENNYSILEKLLVDLDGVLQKLSKKIADIKN